ncbi:MAG: D-glycerate dehydrogenase [Limnohabitans sp.]|nr:D-glycerate dehydrogenase [Limnohabitans sp.]
MSIQVVIARPNFPEVIERLKQHFDVIDNQQDRPWTPQSWSEALTHADGVMTTGADPVNQVVLTNAKRLRICANMAVGYNNFDLPAMTAHGVVGTNTPDVLTETTADFGFALLMATARRISESEHFLRSGQWREWRYDMFAGTEVHGSTLGIIGMGRIGQGIARRASKGFGMQVLYHNRSQLSPEMEAECGARWVDKATLLREADHVMLVVPYSAATHHTIVEAELAQMKPTATLINLARGGIVDDAALAKALKERRIAAAGLDVFEGEPTVHPDLLTVTNVVLTPHIASATVKTRLAMANLAADNLIQYFQHGRVLTPVNPDVLNAPQRRV